MDKKKLFGTIVGVIAFIALIAGATYAWLTSNLSVTNGNYNTRTKNFVINFVNGTAINNDIPVLATATNSTAKSMTVTAGLATNSMPGTLTIYLNVSSIGAHLKDGAIKYSYCITSCSGSDFANHTASVGSSNKIAIISNQSMTSTTPTTYILYFWLDSASIGEDQIGESFSGFISAEATQTAPNS